MKVSLISAQEIKAAEATLNELHSYKNRYWVIDLNGDTFEPDGFLSFFTQK